MAIQGPCNNMAIKSRKFALEMARKDMKAFATKAMNKGEVALFGKLALVSSPTMLIGGAGNPQTSHSTHS